MIEIYRINEKLFNVYDHFTDIPAANYTLSYDFNYYVLLFTNIWLHSVSHLAVD